MTLQRSATLVVSSTTDQQFDVVFNQYGGFVYTIALALLKNRQDAEDAMQEVFIKVYRSLQNYDEVRGSMESWLRTILVNHCRDKWRKRSLLSIPISLLAAGDDGDGNWEEALGSAGGASSDEAGPDMTLLRRESDSELWAAVNSLSEKLRRVVVLRYYIGLSDNEVAETLGLPKGTVYSRLHAAHMRLQAVLTHK